MKTTILTRNMVLTALFAALIAVLAQIQLPIGPVPFNLAVFGVYLAGMLLQPLWAVTSIVVYIMLGLFGIPVFAGFQGGPAALFGKTGGYVIGYLFIALFTALAVKYSANLPKTAKICVNVAAMLGGLFACYAFGTVWFTHISGIPISKALVFCVYPFILPDLAKAVCAQLLGRVLMRRLRHANLT